MQDQAMNIKGVIFHFEGLLTKPQRHDASAITTPTFTAAAKPVLKYLRSKNIRLAIISRSSPARVQKILAPAAIENT